MNSEKFSENWKIPLYKIYTDDEDVNIITKIIKRGNNWAVGPEIEQFEHALSNYVGTDYCVTLNSGTSALHAAYLAYGIGSNDEVIVPSFSFISTANSVLFVNAKPVFADIEDVTFGLDSNSILEKISSNTKAIVPMDYGGSSCNINEIKKISDEKKLFLIEDAAESLGASISGKKVGSISDSSIFSFCGNKVLTTGEGGALVTNSKQIYEKIKLIRSHGRQNNADYFNNPSDSNYIELGYNWRMSSMTAALGISQLSKLDKIITKRQENAKYITSKLSKIPQIQTPIISNEQNHIFQMYVIRLQNQEIRDKLHNFLTKKRIFSKVYFNPIHLTDFYKMKFGYKANSLPVTEQISQQVLTLPLYPNMENEEKDYLVNSIEEFFEN
jgi:perosamine synthetase